MVKEVNGQILLDGVEVRRTWTEYFEQVLNMCLSHIDSRACIRVGNDVSECFPVNV